ncbi:hypothetical protein C7B64_11425 [Merismopedia glauca CCAP 1448/3]|uniref:Uncharacterized protein n=1 Tax=Merismopedia glauca CCAP 1448/3 TaxID=1296344 RepID=A0A2T1C3Y3_9CYAN|nr:hypothetical protein C7B64_11425 [Merismopedia glauca CCAP 1448/3]
MINPFPAKSKTPIKLLKLLPYTLVGLGVFWFNSETNLNYLFRGYLVLLEAQLGILIVYFLMSKINKLHKNR